MKEVSRHNPWLYSFLLFLALIPAWFLHTKGTDWGDDYAQYIHQAQYIGHASEPYTQVLNLEHYGTPKKSIFFSACLSFVNSSISIAPYKMLNTLFYVLSAYLVFLFFRSYFKPWVSVCITLLIYYHPYVLDAKEEILPEFVFMGLFYLVWLLRQMPRKDLSALTPISIVILPEVLLPVANKIQLWLYTCKHIAIPFLLACLLATRSLALALAVPYFLLEWKYASKKWLHLFLGLAAFILCWLLLQALFLSSLPQHELSFYYTIIRNGFHPEMIWQNIKNYANHLTLFFEFEVPHWVNLIFYGTFVCLFISGIVASLRAGSRFLLLVLFLYLLGLVVYPYDGDAIRYLLPVLPLVFYILVQGFMFCSSFLGKSLWQAGFAIVLILVCLGGELKTIQVHQKIRPHPEGPYASSVLYDFAVMQHLVKPHESIAFCKPFLVNLLIHRNSYYLDIQAEKKADYILVIKNKTLDEPFRLNPKGLSVSADTISLSNFYLLKPRH